MSYKNLIEQWEKISKLSSVSSLMQWDHEVMMPSNSDEYRGKMMSVLSEVIHDKMTDPKLIKLIHKTLKEKLSKKERINVGLMDDNITQVRKIPTELVKRETELEVKSYSTWVKSKKSNSFEMFSPTLKKMINIKKEYVKLVKTNKFDSDYDVLLNDYEPNAKSSDLYPVFMKLADSLSILLKEIKKSKKKIKIFPKNVNFDLDKQDQLNREILSSMGFDFNSGRFDKTVHPFCSGTNPTDVRLCTRYLKHDLGDGIGSSMHEGGHGLYEQGLPVKTSNQPIGSAISLGIHESQSRLWENQVGRSYDFWSKWFPIVKKKFPNQLKGWKLEEWYEHINKVKPSLIRIESDEVSYNLHIVVRFILELEIFNDNLSLNKIENRWNELYKKYLGVTPKTPSQGILQDVHWGCGLFGYFPTYTLGNLYSSHFFNESIRDKKVSSGLSSGNLLPLKDWLNKNIHIYGNLYNSEELLKKVTGEKLSSVPFLNYLYKKYDRIYNLS